MLCKDQARVNEVSLNGPGDVGPSSLHIMKFRSLLLCTKRAGAFPFPSCHGLPGAGTLPTSRGPLLEFSQIPAGSTPLFFHRRI